MIGALFTCYQVYLLDVIFGVTTWFRLHNHAVNHHVFWHRARLVLLVKAGFGLAPLDSNGDLVSKKFASISLLCLNEPLLDTFDLIIRFILTFNSLHATA